MNALLLTVFLAASPARADIKSTNAMKDVVVAAGEGTLLVFDLDDTLIEPTQDLGSDHWYHYLAKRFMRKEKLSESAAYDKAGEIWDRVQPILDMKTVEPDTSALLLSKQSLGIQTMALTGRTTDLAAITEKQLASTGISFHKKPVYAQDVDVGTAYYRRGIMYAGDNDKGASLLGLLKKIGYTPKKIVYVDDKMKHVDSVGRAAATLGVSYDGFRYGAADAQVARFDRDMKDPDLYCDGKESGKR